MTFYLGTHEPSWLYRADIDVPLFVSAVRLRRGRSGRSLNARLHDPLPGCTHKSCSNCERWALRWRDGIIPAPVPGCMVPSHG